MALEINLPPNQTGEKVTARMQELKLSISDVAEKMGISYEHVRKIAKGETVPSKLMIQALSEALKIDRRQLERLATADQIRIKFGTIPFELAKKNPELEPLERIWKDLSQEHKDDLIAQAQAWAKRDRDAGKKH